MAEAAWQNLHGRSCMAEAVERTRREKKKDAPEYCLSTVVYS